MLQNIKKIDHKISSHKPVQGLKYFVETYGCQMNEYDSELVANILGDLGYSKSNKIEEADAIFLNTCSIREKAEEIAAAGKAYWDAVMQGAIEFLSGGMMSTPKDEGRRKPVKMENLRGEKPGWKMAEGTNWWSVNEKDPYWQTKEGFKEVMNLYGTKPSWVKEPSLEYNPRTGEYDSIEKEEFVEIKPTKRISL